MLSEMRRTVLDNLATASTQLTLLTNDGSMPNEAGTAGIKRLVHQPDEQVQEVTMNYVIHFGLAKMIGAELGEAEGKSVVNPFVVRAAMPKLTKRFQDLTLACQVLSPTSLTPTGYVEATQEVINFIEGVMEASAALFIANVTHDAVHDGIMTDVMEMPMALLWGAMEYCPLFHGLESAFGELAKAMKEKKKLLSIVYDTPFHAQWSQGLTESGFGLPWWFEKDMAKVKQEVMSGPSPMAAPQSPITKPNFFGPFSNN